MAFATKGVALITGAASGLGEEIGFAFAEAGASGIVFADLNENGAASNAEKSKKYAINSQYKALSIKVDVTDLVSVQKMVDFAVETFGRIDYSINCAGISPPFVPTSDIDIEAFDRTLNVNLKGVMLCVRAVTKAMLGQEPQLYTGRHGERTLGRGSIVNLGSITSHMAGPSMMAYTASKHAVLGLTKVAALDNVLHHIRVNAVCPWWTHTPMLHRSVEELPEIEKVAASTPVGRAAFPEEVANVVVFLCSPSASYINGTGLAVDAGTTLMLRIG